jgi:hypothetical protein
MYKYLVLATAILTPIFTIGAQPRFYHDFDSLNDDVYNKKFVYAAAESCGVDTNVDLITALYTHGYSFVKVLPWKGHYRIMQTRRIDAQWENDRVVMYECFDPDFDTVFVVDTFPEASPEVIGFRREKNALNIYNLCRRYTTRNHPEYRLLKIEKKGINFYVLDAYYNHYSWITDFKVIDDTMSILKEQEVIY